MKTYEPKYSAHTSCATFPYLIQRPVETMDDYHLRAQLAYKMLYDSKPAAVLAMTAAAAQADLWENLRKKVLEAEKDAFFERLDLAGELEAIQQDHSHSQNIAALRAEMLPEVARTTTCEHFTEEEIDQVTAIQALSNRSPHQEEPGW